jgi:hypothetical protein
MLSRKILVILIPVLCGLVLEVGLFLIDWVYLLLLLAVVILLIGSKLIIKDKLRSKEYWYFSLTPALLLLNIYLLILFVQNAMFRQTLLVFAVLVLILYFENIFLYYYWPAKYQPYSIENMSRNYNLISVFMFSVCLYGYLILLDIPIFLLSIILVLFIMLVAKQSMWSNKIENAHSTIYIVILSLIIFEFFWALAFLPISFYVNGFILTLIYYLLFEIFKDKLIDNSLDRRLIVRVIVIFVICLAAALISSRWI